MCDADLHGRNGTGVRALVLVVSDGEFEAMAARHPGIFIIADRFAIALGINT